MVERGTELAGAGWFIDPLERFDGRYFDGDSWTERVSDAGVLRIDPDWPRPTQAVGAVQDDGDLPESAILPSDFGGPERRNGSDRRQVDFQITSDRRQTQRRGDG